MNSVKHSVYVCSWSVSAEGYTLWVISRPQIHATALTLAEAEERLTRVIQEAGGALHVVMEFDPPLPLSAVEEKYSDPNVYLIGGDERFETYAPSWRGAESENERDERLRWSDSYYEKPLCRKCKFTLGKRSTKPLTLRYSLGKYDGAFGMIGTDGGPTHSVISEEFLELLTTEEKQALEFQPVITRGRRSFYELVGPTGPPFVAVSGLILGGWRCGHCDYRLWGYSIKGMAINSFIAKSD
jgi:hypothetical protein